MKRTRRSSRTHARTRARTWEDAAAAHSTQHGISLDAYTTANQIDPISTSCTNQRRKKALQVKVEQRVLTGHGNTASMADSGGAANSPRSKCPSLPVVCCPPPPARFLIGDPFYLLQCV